MKKIDTNESGFTTIVIRAGKKEQEGQECIIKKILFNKFQNDVKKEEEITSSGRLKAPENNYSYQRKINKIYELRALSKKKQEKVLFKDNQKSQLHVQFSHHEDYTQSEEEDSSVSDSSFDLSPSEGQLNKGQKKNLKLTKKQFTDDGYSRGPYRVYSNEDKINAVEKVRNGGSYRDVSREMQIPIKNIRRWIMTGPMRKKGGGRKQMDVDMEKQLYDWIVETLSQTGRKVSRTQIREKALEFSKFKGKFKASKGWTDKFVRKYNLKRAAMKQRMVTVDLRSDGQKIEDDNQQIIEESKVEDEDEIEESEEDRIFLGNESKLENEVKLSEDEDQKSPKKGEIDIDKFFT